MSETILVIKLSALGDFIQATGPMKAIRAAHPDARITLLTTPPFEGMARATGWFDAVWTDGRPGWGDLGSVARLIGRIRKARFSRVYDLQTQGRTVRYFQLLWPTRPPWSGNAPGAAFEYSGAARDRLHVQDSQREQLRIAGIAEVGPPDIGWLTGKADHRPPEPFALLVPGGAPHRPAKRWPAEQYGALAQALAGQGITPVVLGHGDEEAALAAIIKGVEPLAQVLVGKTSFGDIADLARRPGWCCSLPRATRPSARPGRSARIRWSRSCRSMTSPTWTWPPCCRRRRASGPDLVLTIQGAAHWSGGGV